MKEIIILSGVSGVGKTFLLENAIKEYEWLCQVPSVTTRMRRKGVDESYSRIFLDEEDFGAEEANGNLVLINTVFGERYAYRKTDILKHISNKKTVLIEMKISAVSQVRALFSNVTCIYITANRRNMETGIGINRNNQYIRLQDAIDEKIAIEQLGLYANEIDLYFENQFNKASLCNFKKLIAELR